MVSNAGRNKWFWTREEKMVSNTGRKNGFKHGKNKGFQTQEEKMVLNTGEENGFEHGKKKLFQTQEEKILSNTGRKNCFEHGEYCPSVPPWCVWQRAPPSTAVVCLSPSSRSAEPKTLYYKLGAGTYHNIQASGLQIRSIWIRSVELLDPRLLVKL